MEGKSVIDADTVLPLLLIADKYNVKTVLLRCTEWLNCLDRDRLRDHLLAVSPARGKGTCCICMRCHKDMHAVLQSLRHEMFFGY